MLCADYLIGMVTGGGWSIIGFCYGQIIDSPQAINLEKQLTYWTHPNGHGQFLRPYINEIFIGKDYYSGRISYQGNYTPIKQKDVE